MIELITLIAFPLLRMLHGAGKIPRGVMCFFMSWAYGIACFDGSLKSIAHLPAMYFALLWAYSYGWSLESAIHGRNPITDWDEKFSPSGDFVRWSAWHIRNQYILGTLGWMPRILMTFWAACAVAGNVWAVIPLALLWGWFYYLGGVIGRLVKRDIGTRIAEGLTALMLAGALS